MGQVQDYSERLLELTKLYRSERVFILQPERVVLDEKFLEIRLEIEGLQENSSRREISTFAERQKKHETLICEFMTLLLEAEKVHIYSNYRANRWSFS
jgi:hypothetical protein